MAGKVTLQKGDGKNLRIGIVRALWHDELTGSLMRDVIRALTDAGVLSKNITMLEVPGSYELVYGAKTLISRGSCDVVVTIGVLVKGDTMHFEYIAEAVSQGLMQLNVNTEVPVIFGVLTCLTEKQAKERSVGKKSLGRSWGETAVHMAQIKTGKRS